MYQDLIELINSNVPFLSEGIPFLGQNITITHVVLPLIFLVLLNLFGNLVRHLLINKILNRYVEDRKTILSIGNTTKYIIILIGVSFLLSNLGLNKDAKLNYVLIDNPEHPLRLFDLVRFVFYFGLLIYITGKLKTIFVKQVLVNYTSDIGVSQSIGTIVQYFIVLLGAFIIIQNIGLNLGSLNVLAGALGVGIGFGLQNITNNFISGLIILFERPIKVGDRIELGTIAGDVIKVAPRATTLTTNDNISVIVPNSEFISKQVINWSHNDRSGRLHIPVGVSYNEDPSVIKKLLEEVAENNKYVLKHPAPQVLFTDYGDSSLNFDLMVWTSYYISRPIILRSQLYYAIFEKFKEHNIEIPFPQRDLHIRSGLNENKTQH